MCKEQRSSGACGWAGTAFGDASGPPGSRLARLLRECVREDGQGLLRVAVSAAAGLRPI